jgi:hypothetical protein
MIVTIDREFVMDRMKIKSEINKLLNIEEGILLKLTY